MPQAPKLLSGLVELLFPDYNACHLCGRYPERAGLLCQRCAGELRALSYRRLHAVSPQPHPPLQLCLSAYPHSGEARQLVHLLKYQSDGAVARVLGEAMAGALAQSCLRLQEVDAVVPVPLHATRLQERGYNQALLLAQEVCAHTGLALLPDALIRLHATDTQLHRDRAQRLQAMRNAFAVPRAEAVRGRRLLLVDDVLTTGATAMACAGALMASGAAAVSLLTACRA